MTHSRLLQDRALMQGTVAYLQSKQRILFVTTSNRWSGEAGSELPKSTLLAMAMADQVGRDKVTLLDVTKLKLYPCEGNVSTSRGNTCGQKDAALADPEKNPTGHHRCWASINHTDDELWKVSRALLDADAVVFFVSIRWGQTNAYYQTLIERLTWLENRHSTLGEDNILSQKDAGIIIVNHNWRGQEVLQTQKEVLGMFGFQTPQALSWNWQYTQDASDERDSTYQDAATIFRTTFLSPHD